MRVLIVDDEKLAREAIEHIIVSSGYDMKVVAQAQNAKEALSMYKMYNPDVIITDICMDGEDGLNLIEEIHRYDSNSNVIVLSAYEKFEYAKKAYESGAEFYLVTSQQKWTRKSFKKRNESQYFVNLLKPTAFIPRVA